MAVSLNREFVFKDFIQEAEKLYPGVDIREAVFGCEHKGWKIIKSLFQESDGHFLTKDMAATLEETIQKVYQAKQRVEQERLQREVEQRAIQEKEAQEKAHQERLVQETAAFVKEPVEEPSYGYVRIDLQESNCSKIAIPVAVALASIAFFFIR